MRKFLPILYKTLLTAIGSLLLFAGNIPAQDQPVKVTVVSEDDLKPGVVKALPDWEKLGDKAAHIQTAIDLKKALGERPALDLLRFEGGAEGAYAAYEQGKLLIFEHATPQSSSDADNQIRQRLTEQLADPAVYFRRIGNYSVFVFDSREEAVANSLFDRVKYEKSVRWLGENPLIRAQSEKRYIETTAEVFVATVMSIVLGLGSALLLGAICGLTVFYVRKQRRVGMHAFSDAGGMVRLNLDDLSEPISAARLLSE